MKKERKTRIAIDTSSMDGRIGMGTGVFTRSLVEHLRPYRDEFDITLVHRQSVPDDPLYQDFAELVVPHIQLPKFSGVVSEFMFFLRNWGRFDLYHFAHYRLLPTHLFAPARHRTTMQYDGGAQTSADAAMTTQPSLTERFWWFFYRRAFERFLTTSAFGAEALMVYRHLPKEKITILYGGVAPMFVTQGAREDRHAIGKELAEKYGMPERFIIASGRLDPHKNILRLVDAYALLRTKYGIDIPIIVTGGVHTPGYSEQILARIEELGLKDQFIVFKVPDSADMPKFYAAAECMIFPSLREAFGLPLAEAMACGTPTLASRAHAFIEVGGDATTFFNPLDIEDMAGSLAAVLADTSRQNELIRKGYEQVKKFSWDAHAAGFAAMVRALAATSPRIP
jgi:glycosyltransferase involved in cell wall biosynthesis